MKPDDIPQDVWDAVEAIMAEVDAGADLSTEECISLAILAERERCAKVAETCISRTPREGRKTLYKSQEIAVYASDMVAEAIRKGWRP